MSAESDLIKAFDAIEPEPPKFSEERYFRLEEVVGLLLGLLETGKGVEKNDTGDFLHYIEYGEWK
jgi:hypothetical protein